MFAKVDIHWVNKGMMEAAKAQIKENTSAATKSGGVISRFMFMSQSDPLKVTTVTLWKDKQAMEKWRETIRAERAKNPSKNPSPSPWAKIEGDEYDVTQLV